MNVRTLFHFEIRIEIHLHVFLIVAILGLMEQLRQVSPFKDQVYDGQVRAIFILMKVLTNQHQSIIFILVL